MEERDAIYLIAVEKIVPNPFQPRQYFESEGLRELAESIREYGILEPLIVSVRETESPQGLETTYELIAGERRLEAAKLIGLQVVPAIIKRVSEKAKLEIALIENLQRRDLNPIEKARGFSRLIDEFQLTQREVAVRMGKSREYIANALRLLKLPERAQAALRQGELSESQARLLLSLNDLTVQEELLNDMLAGKMTVRDVQARVNAYQQQQEQKTLTASEPTPIVTPGAELELSEPSEEDAATRVAALPVIPEGLRSETPAELIAFASIEQQLEEALGTKVKVQKTQAGLRLEINFYSTAELEQVMVSLAARSSQSKQADLASATSTVTNQTEEPPLKPAMKPLDIFKDLPDEPNDNFSI